MMTSSRTRSKRLCSSFCRHSVPFAARTALVALTLEHPAQKLAIVFVIVHDEEPRLRVGRRFLQRSPQPGGGFTNLSEFVRLARVQPQGNAFDRLRRRDTLPECFIGKPFERGHNSPLARRGPSIAGFGAVPHFGTQTPENSVIERSPEMVVTVVPDQLNLHPEQFT